MKHSKYFAVSDEMKRPSLGIEEVIRLTFQSSINFKQFIHIERMRHEDKGKRQVLLTFCLLVHNCVDILSSTNICENFGVLSRHYECEYFSFMSLMSFSVIFPLDS